MHSFNIVQGLTTTTSLIYLLFSSLPVTSHDTSTTTTTTTNHHHLLKLLEFKSDSDDSDDFINALALSGQNYKRIVPSQKSQSRSEQLYAIREEFTDANREVIQEMRDHAEMRNHAEISEMLAAASDENENEWLAASDENDKDEGGANASMQLVSTDEDEWE